MQSIQKNTGYADRARAVFGESSGMSKESQKIFQSQQTEDLKYLREKFNNLQRLKTNQEKLFKDNEQSLTKEKLMEFEKNKILREQLQLKERLAAIQKQQIDIAEKAKGIDPSLGGFKGTGGPPNQSGNIPSPAGGGGGGTPSGPEGGLMSTLVKAIGIQRLAGLIAGGIQGTANFAASTFFEYQQNMSRQQAGIVGQTARASGVDALLSGKGIEGAYFAPERFKALRAAQQATDGLSLRGLGGLGAATVAGAGTGAALGGGIGAVFGGVGAAPGAMIGGAIGAAAGFGKSIFSGQTGAYMQGVLNPNDTGAGAVERYRASYFAENFQKNMEAEKEKNYFKMKSLDYLEGNRDRFINAQQTMGLNDQGMFNFLGNNQNGMFTTDQRLGAANQIAGAGGSTAQMRNATQALSLQRGYGIQNAGAILGGLSGNIGGGKAVSDEVTKKILADAFSVGLDASNFSRETEKFVSQSARFIEQSGARSPEAMAKIAASMGDFTTGTSMQNIESAGQAREYMEGKLGAGGSEYQKSLQLSSMMRNKSLSKLSRSQMISLTNMTPDVLNAGGMEVEAMAQQAGMSVEQFQEEANKSKQFSMTPTSRQDERLNKIKQMSSKLGIGAGNYEELKAAIDKETDPEKKKQLQAFLAEQGQLISETTSYDSSLAGQKATFKESLLGGMTGFGEKRDLSKAMPTRATTGFENAQEAQAKSEQAMLGVAQDNFKEYVQSAQKVKASTKEMIEAFENFVNAVNSKSTEINAAAEKLVNTGYFNTPAPTGVRPPKR